MTPVPPALVARLPPMVQEPSEARKRGNRRPARSASACALARTMPASTVIVLEARSISRKVRMRCSDSTIAVGAAGDLAADEAGIAALRHDRRSRLAAKPHDGGDLRRRARANDAERAPREKTPRLAEIADHIGGLCQHIPRADDRLEGGDEASASRHSPAGACQLYSFEGSDNPVCSKLNARPTRNTPANLPLWTFKSLIFFRASRYTCGLRRSVAQFG